MAMTSLPQVNPKNAPVISSVKAMIALSRRHCGAAVRYRAGSATVRTCSRYPDVPGMSGPVTVTSGAPGAGGPVRPAVSRARCHVGVQLSGISGAGSPGGTVPLHHVGPIQWHQRERWQAPGLTRITMPSRVVSWPETVTSNPRSV